MKQPDAIIIGAGVIGCAIAFELAKKGYQVLAVDKNDEVGHGSTSNSCAIVRTCYSTYQGVALAYEGIFYWRDWENYVEHKDERGFARYIDCGMIQIKSEDDHWKKVLPLYDKIGIKYEEWDLDQLKQKMPIFNTDSFWPPSLPQDDSFWQEPEGEITGAIFVPGEGYINDPVLATHNLRRAAEAYGAEFLLGRKVVAVRRDEERVRGITLDGGQEIETRIVVNVAGPHSFVINRLAGVEAGMNIKTKALRHEVHFVPAPKGVDFEKIGCPTSDNDNGIYFRPETGNLILVGSGDPPCDPMEWIEDPDDYHQGVTKDRWKAQTYRLAKRFRDMRLPSQPQGLVDLYDVSDDWIPIYDKSDLKGFYMAIGTSGNQFKNAGPVGHLMAELIDRCERGHDHDRDPLVVPARYTGLQIEVGFYSRLRETNPESSFSVLG
ncbi:MAG: NAD(P)/FAD-dependent oxidoreductase [Anaerolineae bacterium]